MILEFWYPFLVRLFGLQLLTTYVLHVKVTQPVLRTVCQVWPLSFMPNPSGSHRCQSVSHVSHIFHFLSSSFSFCYVLTSPALAFVCRGRWRNFWFMVIYQHVEQTQLTWYLVHLKIKSRQFGGFHLILYFPCTFLRFCSLNILIWNRD